MFSNDIADDVFEINKYETFNIIISNLHSKNKLLFKPLEKQMIKQKNWYIVKASIIFI